MATKVMRHGCTDTKLAIMLMPKTLSSFKIVRVVYSLSARDKSCANYGLMSGEKLQKAIDEIFNRLHALEGKGSQNASAALPKSESWARKNGWSLVTLAVSLLGMIATYVTA